MQISPRETPTPNVYIFSLTAVIMLVGGGYLCCSQKDWAVGSLNVVSGAGLIAYEQRQRK
jgi:1,4-dihydroxy-2-naphthoate octaprenyltransferase